MVVMVAIEGHQVVQGGSSGGGSSTLSKATIFFGLKD